MKELVALLSNPLVWKLVGGYWIFSAFVGALPTPREGSTIVYQIFFRFFHILAGNVNRAAVALKVPGADDKS